MPHGFKRDVTMTRAMRENRFLMERGSFCTLPDVAGKVHFHLEGSDRSRMRQIVYIRAKGRCQNRRCGAPIVWDTFEMDHIKGGLSERCDCLHNLRALCLGCHRARHPQVKFGPGRQEAIKDFDALHGGKE